MALLLAPYNNGMRVGQGFNSYTQQICIDDAVVLRVDQKENIVDNTGLTMRQQADKFRGALENQPAEQVDIPLDVITAVVQNHKAIEVPKIERKENRDALERASDAAMPPELRASQEWRELVDLAKKNKNTKIYEFKERDGPSQIIIWTSKFVSKISDITDDMNISGLLSIKYGTIGGSGRGSFVDASQFQESDLNFYISVKVINQSINFADSLEFRPLKNNIDLEKNDFTKIFGDSFISGFLEGGEFNGLVSMKVLNDAKKTDIAVAAKVALTVGAAEISAEAQVDIAKQNLHENTETTIQVSWSGGGHIKPRDQPWDIDALLAAAARFPDLVCRTPQRTYAILTKYEGLRSYHESKKAQKNFTPLQYENASLYTNHMLDAYMDYKALYRTVSDQIFEIENGIRRFRKKVVPGKGVDGVTPNPDEDAAEEEPEDSRQATAPATNSSDPSEDKQYIDPSVFDESDYPRTLRGMERARVDIRKQMSYIVSEVDEIINDPLQALNTKRIQPFQGVVTFRTRLPKTEYTNPANNVPLSMKKISMDQAKAKNIPIYPADYGPLEGDAKDAVDLIIKNNPAVSLNFRMDKVEGSHTGAVFNDLVVLRPEFIVRKAELQMFKGRLGALRLRYTNGVSVVHGTFRDNLETQKMDLEVFKKEVIMSCSIETGVPDKVLKDGAWVDYVAPAVEEDDAEYDHVTDAASTPPPAAATEKKDEKVDPAKATSKAVVTALRLYTNRGQTLEGAEPVNTRGKKTDQRGDIMFKEINEMDYDTIMDKGSIKGFWGWSHESLSGGPTDLIYGLAPVWGCPPTD